MIDLNDYNSDPDVVAERALDPAIKVQKIKKVILDKIYEKRYEIADRLVATALTSDQGLKEALERSLGKVKEDFNITAKIDQQVTITDDRLNQILRVTAKRVGAIPAVAREIRGPESEPSAQ